VRIRGVPGADRPVVQWLLVALCLVIVVQAGLLIRRDRETERGVRAMAHDLRAAAERQESLEREVARERSAREAFEIGLGKERAANTLPGIPLEPGLDSDGKPKQQLRIPADVGRVQLVLPVGGKRFDRYRVAIRPWTGGEELWVHAMVRADVDPKRVFVPVPVEVLTPGAYALLLGGFRQDGSRDDFSVFTFEVTRP
jgi:hypothetical protein